MAGEHIRFKGQHNSPDALLNAEKKRFPELAINGVGYEWRCTDERARGPVSRGSTTDSIRSINRLLCDRARASGEDRRFETSACAGGRRTAGENLAAALC